MIIHKTFFVLRRLTKATALRDL